jgi:hypothetical protein
VASILAAGAAALPTPATAVASPARTPAVIVDSDLDIDR